MVVLGFFFGSCTYMRRGEEKGLRMRLASELPPGPKEIVNNPPSYHDVHVMSLEPSSAARGPSSGSPRLRS